jgi:hypothetical protein
MPGHPIPKELLESTKKDVEVLERLFDEHDVVFQLMDSRESRWLPTVMGAAKKKVNRLIAMCRPAGLTPPSADRAECRFGIRHLRSNATRSALHGISQRVQRCQIGLLFLQRYSRTERRALSNESARAVIAFLTPSFSLVSDRPLPGPDVYSDEARSGLDGIFVRSRTALFDAATSGRVRE